MKKLLQLLGLSIIGLYAFCEKPNHDLKLPFYPKYKTAMIEFLNKYSLADIQYPYHFCLAKKPDGWHAMVTYMLKEEPVKDVLFWNRKGNKYEKMDFPERDDQQTIEDYQEIVNDWQYNYFTAISPFWGYIGWDKDVIDEYGDDSNLSDTLSPATCPKCS